MQCLHFSLHKPMELHAADRNYRGDDEDEENDDVDDDDHNDDIVERRRSTTPPPPPPSLLHLHHHHHHQQQLPQELSLLPSSGIERSNSDHNNSVGIHNRGGRVLNLSSRSHSDDARSVRSGSSDIADEDVIGHDDDDVDDDEDDDAMEDDRSKIMTGAVDVETKEENNGATLINDE